MGWWRRLSLIRPLRQAWFALSARIKAAHRTNQGGGILKLRDDVQTCGYHDVQVMWEMLRRSSELQEEIPSPKKRNSKGNFFWRSLPYLSQRHSQTTSAWSS